MPPELRCVIKTTGGELSACPRTVLKWMKVKCAQFQSLQLTFVSIVIWTRDTKTITLPAHIIASTFPRTSVDFIQALRLSWMWRLNRKGTLQISWNELTFTQEHFGFSSSNTGAFLSHPFTCKIFKIKLNMARILNNIFKMSTDRYLITLQNRNMKKHVSLLHRLDHICYISYMTQKAAKSFRIRFEAPPTALFTLIIWNSGRMPFWNSARLYRLSSHERTSGRVQIHPAFSETSWKLISSSRKPNQSCQN